MRTVGLVEVKAKKPAKRKTADAKSESGGKNAKN